MVLSMKKHLIGLAALTSLASLTSGCIVVAGTQDFEEGTGGSGTGGAGDGGAGGSSGTTTSTGSSSTGTGGGTTTSTGSGGGCVSLTVNVLEEVGDVKVDLDTGNVDFKFGDPPEACVPPGTRTLSAECDGEEGDYPIAVDWGYEPCGVSPTCQFELSSPMVFTISGANCQ